MDDFLERFAQKQAVPDPETGKMYKFSTVREGLVVSLLSIGTMSRSVLSRRHTHAHFQYHKGTLIGALLGAYIADALGRRRAMTVECGVFIAGVLIQITAMDAWYQIAIGRLVSGLGVGALSAAVPMVSLECQVHASLGRRRGTKKLFVCILT